MAIDTEQVRRLIAGGESFTVEFKGEERQRLADHEIIETVVCLANAEGGILLVGVENDGRVSGARRRHETVTEPRLVQATIFNRTAPPVNTRVSLHAINESEVLAVEVDAYPEICATIDGKCVRRIDGIDGPECRPFLPHEHASRRSDLGLIDYSAQVVDGTTWDDLDPLEFERLRQTVERQRGEASLLALSDTDLAMALELVEHRSGQLAPNVAGLLLLGRETAIRRRIPTHEIAFQVLDTHGNVVVNDWFRGTILQTLEEIQIRTNARIMEREAIVGLFRLPIPDYSREAVREAINNAVVHRDYARAEAVHIQFHPNHLLITNPGGFLEGITLDNILVHGPKPRNRRLADVFRRIGLVERTGRGVDRIYEGQLRYGRPIPDYSRSSRNSVQLDLRGGEGSLEFAVFVFEQSGAGQPLGIDELLVLNHLFQERRADSPTLARLMQRDVTHARGVVERMLESGLVEARGERSARIYHLSAVVYRRLGAPVEYVRARGFDSIRQGALVLEYVEAHGSINRAQVVQLCGLAERQASYLLHRLVQAGKLRQVGTRRHAHYTLA